MNIVKNQTITNINKEKMQICQTTSVYPLIAFFIISFIPLLFHKYERIAIMAQMLLLITTFVFNIYKYPGSYFIYLVAVFYSFIAVFYNGSGFGNFIVYFNVVLFLLIVKNNVFSQKQYDILNITLIIGLGIILLLHAKKDGMYYTFLGNKDIVLNPNGYATLILAFGGILLSFVADKMKNPIYKGLICMLLYAFIMFILFKSQARAEMGAWLIYGLLNIIITSINHFSKVERKKNNAYLYGMICALLCSILIIVGYILLSKVLPSDIKILGKSFFSGREKIWEEAINMYYDNFLFGINNDYMFMGKYKNPHNGFLSLMCYLSVVALFNFALLVINSVKKGHGVIDKNRYLMIIAFIFSMTFEVVIIDGLYYCTLLPFFLLRKGENYDT